MASLFERQVKRAENLIPIPTQSSDPKLIMFVNVLNTQIDSLKQFTDTLVATNEKSSPNPTQVVPEMSKPPARDQIRMVDTAMANVVQANSSNSLELPKKFNEFAELYKQFDSRYLQPYLTWLGQGRNVPGYKESFDRLTECQRKIKEGITSVSALMSVPPKV
jgi:hypothetical protein